MRKTIGIFAHVDAGKTTFSEQILYHAGVIRGQGPGNQPGAWLDTHALEQQRGITIFAEEAYFHWQDDIYYLIDTPGHVDFSGETQRIIGVLDYAILLVSGTAGVQAHTTTLFRLLQDQGVPTFIFVNKRDLATFQLPRVLGEIRDRLTADSLYLAGPTALLQPPEEVAEFVAERDEEFLLAYLEGEDTPELLRRHLIDLIKQRKCFPVTSGSALRDLGVKEFLDLFSLLTVTEYQVAADEPSFVGRVYKIRHEPDGNRLVFLKALAGTLQVRDEFRFDAEGQVVVEKVNTLRVYNGARYETRQRAVAGDVIAVTGLKTPVCGTVLTTDQIITPTQESSPLVPALRARVILQDDTPVDQCLQRLRLLSDEDPMLAVTFQEESGEILVSVMGRIQLEVLEEVIASRFGMAVTFGPPQVQYRETIAASVVGFGHFEPLRHYAEVQLRLEPNPRGKGITFASECHVDDLPLNYQRLIRSHVFDKTHRGVLTGAPLTDVNIVLQAGLAHEKHTAGGDFREATHRAIRQGLEKAESILLEPYYRFQIYVDEADLGRVIADIQRLQGTFDPPIHQGKTLYLEGRGPVATFMDYSVELVSFTKGRGSITCVFDGYEPCHNPEEVIASIGYDKDRDTANPSSSVFCAKGTSFIVPWYEAEKYMHTLK